MLKLFAVALILSGSSMLVWVLTMGQEATGSRPGSSPAIERRRGGRRPLFGHIRDLWSRRPGREAPAGSPWGRGQVSFEESFDLTSPTWVAGEPSAFTFGIAPDEPGHSRIRGLLELVLLIAVLGAVIAVTMVGLAHFLGKAFTSHFTG
jgi:hypothetical protein